MGKKGRREDGDSDTAVWLAGSKEKTGQSLPGIGPSSIAHETIGGLQEIGFLDDIIATKEGLVVYPLKLITAVLLSWWGHQTAPINLLSICSVILS
jgi:hypothetical protein